ncbi:DeoR/GlpR family DNA-binding transcription regulator [Terrihabitans rhizophilus]|uniref:DeoR/GlpR family DNA-binding transcription regulator n=1 Tax=Terrihabitans rhizophilus TaxID=3092662 RepID=A0ABU4RP71_9HYPH|nr:DeoR/GlpR family DNA-binding transcription regulator [Terrihabitans sp. PJ23]MDX6805993.1 DeoR/GlpR family DNA-binding transcription regulator [Terrihabitans sp. PJ23]
MKPQEIPTEEAASSRVPAQVRRGQILEIATRNGFVSVSGIAETLGVSEMTVRRDLEALQEQGLVDRTFGGAVRREVYEAEEPAFDRRRRDHGSAKAAIARAAAALVKPRETVGVDVGTTALALAEELTSRADLRLFTNNLRAAMQLGSGRSPVYVPGGQVRDVEMSIVGAAAVAQLRTYFLDRVFIGVSGITEKGLYDYSVEDTEVKRTFIEQAEAVVVLCDSSKFDRRSLAFVGALDEVDVLITDKAPPPHLAAALEAAKVQIIVAGAAPAADRR